jgi:hypothetical protein
VTHTLLRNAGGHYVTLVVGHFLSTQKFLNKDKMQATLLVAVFPI